MVGGAVGSVVFWDDRGKAEVANFTDSFVEDVTDLALEGNALYGCSQEGLVCCFDTTKSEDNAVEWTYKFSNPVEGLRLQNNHILAHTSDHLLGLLDRGTLIKKYTPNTP